MYSILMTGIGIALFTGIVSAEEINVAQEKSLKPDPAIQDTLHRLALPPKSGEEWKQKLDALRQVPKDELVRQLLLFALDAKGMEEAMLPAIIMEQLKIPVAQIPYAFADCLDTASAVQQKEMKNWLGGVEAQDRKGPPNFTPYVELLRHRQRTGAVLPNGLLRHMYVVDPREAFFSMMRFYELGASKAKPLVWSDHLVYEVLWRKEWKFEIDDDTLATAKTELDKLSQSDHWWVRLYVAEIIRKHPELGSGDTVDRLKADTNELVRKAIQPPKSK